MIKAIALDDELPALQVIRNFCDQVEYVDLVKTFHQPGEALRYIQQYPVELLFLDIQMPAISGIDFYKSLPQQSMVIFTTAYSEYAVEGFNVNAVDYLLKPFSFERFTQAVQKARDYYKFQQQTDNSALFIRVDYSLLKIDTQDILYIEALDDYLKIHLHNQKPVIARMTMKTMQEKLPASFVRVHRSYIVPLQRVEHVRNKTIQLGNAQIPIGSNYEEQFFKLFSR